MKKFKVYAKSSAEVEVEAEDEEQAKQLAYDKLYEDGEFEELWPLSNFDAEVVKNKIPLYYGNNGVQKFWESEDRSLLIMQNIGETAWTAMRNNRVLADKERQKRLKGEENTFYILSATDSYVLRDLLEKQYDIYVEFDFSKQWQYPCKMKLTPTHSL